MHVVTVSALIILAFLGFLILSTPCVHKYKHPKYKHPKNSVGVGPVWTEEKGPPLPYMWIWLDSSRMNMEFRNMPGVVIKLDSRVVPELSESLNQISSCNARRDEV